MKTQILNYFTDSGGTIKQKLNGVKINDYESNKKPTQCKVSPREELIILALAGKELYGLQIAKAIAEASEGFEQIRIGTLYPTLKKLEEKDLVTSRWGDERPIERCGARRRYYKLTEKGSQTSEYLIAFRENLLNWQSKKADNEEAL